MKIFLLKKFNISISHICLNIKNTGMLVFDLFGTTYILNKKLAYLTIMLLNTFGIIMPKFYEFS